jgi:sec-independent protein translocase protein TatA
MMNVNAITMVGKLGPTEILLVVLVLVLLFGPKYLPKLGQTLGNSIRGFKDGLSGDEEKVAENNENGKTEA